MGLIRTERSTCKRSPSSICSTCKLLRKVRTWWAKIWKFHIQWTICKRRCGRSRARSDGSCWPYLYRRRRADIWICPTVITCNKRVVVLLSLGDKSLKVILNSENLKKKRKKREQDQWVKVIIRPCFDSNNLYRLLWKKKEICRTNSRTTSFWPNEMCNSSLTWNIPAVLIFQSGCQKWSRWRFAGNWV